MYFSPSPPVRLAALLAVPLVVAALNPAPAWSQEEDGASASLAITPVTVIDVRDGVARPDRSVVVEGDRITAVGPAGSVRVPADAHVVDGGGKFLIPGLWDMHVHSSSDRITRETILPMYVANGVTGVRDMHADCFEPCADDRSTIEEVRSWSRDIEAGRLVGPRIVASSQALNGPPPGEPSSIREPGTEDHARALVRLLADRGADLIKIYTMLPREAYFALAEEAKRLGLPFGGHVPVAVRASEASDAGQASIEHPGPGNVLEECSSREDEHREEVLERLQSESPHMMPVVLRMIDSYSDERCERLFARFVENGTWVVPTLVTFATAELLGWRDDPRLEYVTPEERAVWRKIQAYEIETLFGTDPASFARLERKVHEIVLAMHRAGVRIMAGSDVLYTVAVRRVPRPSRHRPEIVTVGSEADSTIVGVPLRLYRSGAAVRGEGAAATAVIEDNIVTDVQRRDPFPGNTLMSSPEPWRDANGSGTWPSPDSDGNEIVGNRFEDVAAAAVVVEGDSNHVELRSAGDTVRDVGTGNRIVVAQEAAVRGEWVAVEGEMYGVPVPEASLPLIRFTFDDAQGRWTLPGHPQTFRYTVHGEAAPDSLDLHLAIEAPRTWLIPVRSGMRGDTLDVAFPLAEPYDSAQGDPPRRPESAAPGRTGPYLRLSLVRRSAAASETSGLTEEEKDAADRIDADAIERRTRALVAPEMEGRESGQPGGERAARAIAGWFREVGLEPLGDDGFLQRVPLILGRAAPTSSLNVGDTTFRVGDDFAIASLSMRTRPAMRFEATAEVVLFGPSLGYGRADAPLPELDVEGKIVAWVVQPGPGDGSGIDLTRTYEALHRGGAGAVIALFPGPVPEAWLRSPVFSEIGALDADLYGSGPARPLVFLGEEAFGALFGDGSEVRAFIGGFTPGEHRVRPTGRTATLSYEIEETTAAPTHNVVGVLRGSDPELRDEAVVYTAHYDAFGVYGGDVYAGAADNALGVAKMIEIADALRASGVRPRRSLVFLAVGAEERGMLGTLYWTRHPTWPLDRVVANINMDGGDAEAWGPLHGVIDLTRQATLVDPTAEVGAAMDVPVLPNDATGGGGSSSDFYDFLRTGIPAIQLMGIGGDPALSRMRMQRFGGHRVHQPGDTIDGGWDWAGPQEMAQLYLLLGLRVANAEELPRLREGSPFRNAGEEGGS